MTGTSAKDRRRVSGCRCRQNNIALRHGSRIQVVSTMLSHCTVQGMEKLNTGTPAKGRRISGCRCRQNSNALCHGTRIQGVSTMLSQCTVQGSRRGLSRQRPVALGRLQLTRRRRKLRAPCGRLHLRYLWILITGCAEEPPLRPIGGNCLWSGVYRAHLKFQGSSSMVRRRWS